MPGLPQQKLAPFITYALAPEYEVVIDNVVPLVAQPGLGIVAKSKHAASLNTKR